MSVRVEETWVCDRCHDESKEPFGANVRLEAASLGFGGNAIELCASCRRSFLVWLREFHEVKA